MFSSMVKWKQFINGKYDATLTLTLEMTHSILTCPGGGLFIVLRARWILWGAGDAEGDGDAVPQEEVGKGIGGGMGLLLAGPETLIFALPGDNVIDVGEEGNEEADVDGSDFAA